MFAHSFASTIITGRRTRASSAVSSVSGTDSPVRRTTRRNRQVAVIVSSPESVDDSIIPLIVRTTRSRTATLDKSTTAGIVKNLRSRKNSASSNVSETIDLESETTQKRVTRKAAAAAAAFGTPTKTNLRSHNLRAGSEAKATPPASRSTRLTRASSVDPFNTPNESVGTPVKRRARASMVPVQQTVTEEQEAPNKTPESLEDTAFEIDDDSEIEKVFAKGKSSNKMSKSSKEIRKDSTEHSNLDTSKMNEGNMSDKSYTSNASNEDSTLNALTPHSIASKLEPFTSRQNESFEKIDPKTANECLVSSTDKNLIKPDILHANGNESNCDSLRSKVDVNDDDDDDCELVDIENITLTDDSIDVVNSPKNVDARDILALDIRDSYVKLNRTNSVEKIVSDRLEESKNNDNNLSVKSNDSDSVSQSNVITNAKTAIVLVNDFIKSNEYVNSIKNQQTFDSGISLNHRDDINYTTSTHENSDDQLSTASMADNDQVSSLKLSSSHENEVDMKESYVEVVPDDEKNYFNKVADEFVHVQANRDRIDNFSSEKSDVCLKKGVVPENTLKLENLTDVREKNYKTENSVPIIIVEIADEIADDLISENSKKVDFCDMRNASGNAVIMLNSLKENDDSVSMNIDSDANMKSSSVDANLTVTKPINDEKSEVVESSGIEIMCDNGIKSNVSLSKNIVVKKNDSLKVDSNRAFEIERKLLLEDKNGVPSAVTGADGEDASSPCKQEGTNETSTDTTPTISPEKMKRRSRIRVIDSDLDESAENLFQDIPAEEWSKSNESERIAELEHSSVSRKSLGKNQIDKSSVKITNVASETDNPAADLSLASKARKSLEKKRESGQSSDSGIQDGNKTVVENATDEIDNEMNESSRHKSRRSMDNSFKANQSLTVQDNNYSISEKLAKSMNDHNSSSRNRKSLNYSNQSNVSVFDTSASSKTSNASRKLPLNDTRKSIAEEKIDEDSETEEMEVDENGDSENKMNRANDSSKKTRKSLDAGKIYPNNSDNGLSLEKSSTEQNHEKEIVNNAEKSTEEVINNKSLPKSPISFNKSPALNQSDSSKLHLSASFDESKKLKKRLSEKLKFSSGKSPVKQQHNEDESAAEEMEVDVASDKSLNASRKSLNASSSKKSLNRKGQASPNAEAQTSFRNKDKSAKETFDSKSANTSHNSSEIVVDGDVNSDSDDDNEAEKKNKSTSKCYSVKDEENAGEQINKGSPTKMKGQEVESVPLSLDRSLQNSIERMKFANPTKHNVSTIVQVNSSSQDDSDDSQISYFMQKLTNKEKPRVSSDEGEKDGNDVDSDIEREYNLGGNSISKYSDDDVPGDDCRVSEEESSDDEDDGADLDGFVIPDEELDEDGDETDDESDEEDEGEDDHADTEEVNVSVNSSQSTLKNTSVHPRKSDVSASRSGTESEDESTEAENNRSKEEHAELVEDSKIIKEQCTGPSDMIKGKNSSWQQEDNINSMDKSSKTARGNVSSSSETDDESERKVREERGTNASVIKNKSLNVSKCKKMTNIQTASNDETESSSTESDDSGVTSQVNRGKSVQIGSPSETESESEEGEDYYRVVNAEESSDSSLLKKLTKNKKLIDCSTPKVGAAKKRDISKDKLSITASASSRRKSGSLNDLTERKMSSRLSIGEAINKSMKLKGEVEIVATPGTVSKTRQAWKLIPLNQTAHPTVEDTPGTKFLKKAKLNESFPVLDSMKSSNSTSKAAHKQLEFADQNSKKRKLLDDDSILKVSKKSKKRARLDDKVQETGKKKKNAKVSKAADEESAEKTEEQPKRKGKKKFSATQAADEEDQKPDKKKKCKASEAEQNLNNKSKRQVVENPGEEARSSEMEQELDSLKKKRKEKLQQHCTKSLKRLPEDVVENLLLNLADEPHRRPNKRQKLSNDKERSVIIPSQSMFSPGKSTPVNLRVDDGYVPLSSLGGTTQFAVVNLQKAKRVVKRSAAVLNFRDKMLARNKRMPTSAYLSYLKKQKAKNKK